MWGPELAEAFERDGHVTLKGAFDPDAATRMSEAIWHYVESRTEIRRTDRSSWPQGAPAGISFKKLKRHVAFRAVIDSASTRSALDGIFGVGAWEPIGAGAQILFSFPDTPPGRWGVPSHLWHMDAPFFREISPPLTVKLFSVVEPLPPCGGATVVLSGTPRLQAVYTTNLSDEDCAGNKPNWHQFMRQTDPWLAQFLRPELGPDRNAVLTEPHVVDGQPVELRELGGEPGDVHLCHINLFHSAAPNTSDRPRMMVTHGVRPVRADPSSRASPAAPSDPST